MARWKSMGLRTPLKIAVAGLWHLGCVTAACCARAFRVTGFDEDEGTLGKLNVGRAPVFEPGLNELILHGLSKDSLAFTIDPATACASADVLWVTYDTPVSDDDVSDVELVMGRIRRCASLCTAGTVVLISSQLPVGTCRRLEHEFESLTFAYSPENLQLGKAIQSFETANRIVVGTRDGSSHPVLDELLSRFCENIQWMKTESAEMVKHALNSFLALSITFINEIAAVCEQTGADVKEVSLGLKTDARIGPRAYLSAGGAFAGGTLARDVVSLVQIAQERDLRLDVIPAIKRSNDWHRGWALRHLEERLGNLQGRRIGLLGLTYKPGTDTLRRSAAVELAGHLTSSGVSVHAWDPVVKAVPKSEVTLHSDPVSVAANSDALVLCTEWPEFRKIDWRRVLAAMKRPLVLDANRFLEQDLSHTEAEYLSVGRI